MSAITAPKVKAFITGIKDRYLDGRTDGTSSDTHQKNEQNDPWGGLLQVELVLRGILPNPDKLWSQIEAAIGKQLLVEQRKQGNAVTLPTPLWAGIHVVAGRLAEAVASTTTTTTTLNESRRTVIDTTIIQRAKDIKDIRWMMLLLIFPHVSFYDIARGYYSQAVQIEPDTPPMWKKVWDIWTLLSIETGQGVMDLDESTMNIESTTPFEARGAIQQLIRIALAKGNTKRAAELQVRLVASYLNPLRLPVATEKIGKQEIVVAQAFGDSLTEKLTKETEIILEEAQDTMRQIPIQILGESEMRLIPVLTVRLRLALHDVQVENLALTKHQSNQNRSITTSTIDSCRIQSRRKLFLEEKNDDVWEASIALRDSVVDLWSISHRDPSYWQPSLEAITKSIDYLQDRAMVILQKDIPRGIMAWSDFLRYLVPIVETFQIQARWTTEFDRQQGVVVSQEWISTLSGTEANVLALVSMSAVKTAWMMLAINDSSDYWSDDKLWFLVDILTALLDRTVPIEARATDAVGSSNKQTPATDQWKTARSVLLCFLAQGNATIISQVSREAVSTRKQENAMLGTLQCLVSWSGWYQRPWLYCSNLSDVRRLLLAASLVGDRSLGEHEVLLLTLARADAELLNGGFPKLSKEHFERALGLLEANSSRMDTSVILILKAHCCSGLARAQQLLNDKDSTSEALDLARKALDFVNREEDFASFQPLHVWREGSLLNTSMLYQRSVARQLIADCLISRGQYEQARSFLEDAVREGPGDSDAAVALGAFLLRVALYLGTVRSPDSVKAAQIQLLKAAKLDSSKADPFALLGIWFEALGDRNRALGCFSKCLGMDPCHPVAGRGILRLKGRDAVKEELDAAIDNNSSLSGWAWRAVGVNKLLVESEDEYAVIALLKALRTRDIASPESEAFGVFYALPHSGYVNERSHALAELAMCYRRLGRFTPSIRAFHAAIESAGDRVAPEVLCSCAQVELELSLFDEAAEKFGRILSRERGPSHALAAYGQGIALHSMARRDLADGKAGSAMVYVKRAIESCEDFSVSFSCTRKLLGDLYSFGASLPSDLFGDESEEYASTGASLKQIEFTRKGEAAYRSVVETMVDDYEYMKASAVCDIGCNILLQALLRAGQSQGMVEESSSSQENLRDLARAETEFKTALQLDPLHPAAWCGLGCTLSSSDPLLAQHALSRCLQIEKTFADAYANLGFLYTSKNAFGPSESVMNALTQVADTPFMWMNRAFMFEKNAQKSILADQTTVALDLSRAADAYRAALQVMKHPEAQLGLAMSSRITTNGSDVEKTFRDIQSGKDTLALLKEYNASSSRIRETVSLLEGVMTLEQVMRTPASWNEEAAVRGEKLITVKDLQSSAILVNVVSMNKASSSSSERESQCKDPPIFNVDATSLQRQILHEPTRPELWLKLAKDYIRTGNDDSAIQSAEAAASRAASMLSDMLVRGHSDAQVCATSLAEALALSHWLRDHLPNAHPDETTRKEENQTDTSAPGSSRTQSDYAIQRALMMDPLNRIARKALQLSESSVS